MSIDTWRIERLETTEAEYEKLIAANMQTIGDIKSALRAGTEWLAQKANISIARVQELAVQIAVLEKRAADTGEDAGTETDNTPQMPAYAATSESFQQAAKRTVPVTLDGLKVCRQDTITPEMVAEILNCSAQSICNQAKADADALGFPVSVICGAVRIPRRGFIYFMEYGRASDRRKI